MTGCHHHGRGLTADLCFGLNVTERLLLRFGAQNVADRQIVNHLSSKNPFTGDRIAEPGRMLYVNVGYSFYLRLVPSRASSLARPSW